jgi:hypothetical protein
MLLNKFLKEQFPVYRQSHPEPRCVEHRPFQPLQQLRGP